MKEEVLLIHINSVTLSRADGEAEHCALYCARSVCSILSAINLFRYSAKGEFKISDAFMIAQMFDVTFKDLILRIVHIKTFRNKCKQQFRSSKLMDAGWGIEVLKNHPFVRPKEGI